VKKPMDLGTVKTRLAEIQYGENLEAFASDVRTTFMNAMLYNPPHHNVHRAAKALLAEFEQDHQKVFAKKDTKARPHECNTCAGRICEACGEKCLK
jgi:hypothetical protein